jgi:hypothetical protein
VPESAAISTFNAAAFAILIYFRFFLLICVLI